MADDNFERWLDLVEDDIRQVVNNLRGPLPSLPGAAYHCQQAGEKLVKAILVSASIDFPRTHDIAALVGLIPSHHPLRGDVTDFGELTPFATVYRYPAEDEFEPPQVSELETWRDRIEKLLAKLR